jgi:taurine dioxygenase
VEVTRLNGALGAEVRGVDLAQSLDRPTTAALRQAFLDHLVLLFRGQSLSPARHVAFTEDFGAVEPHPLAARRTVEGFPGVLLLENRPGLRGARNDFWHSDISHAECPPMATCLHALEVPQGLGDTMFCNTYAAYESLSPGLCASLDGLAAWHSAEATMRRNHEEASDGQPIGEVPPPVAHPVVRTHPQTGRRALYVNPFFTTHLVDMTPEESRPLLEMLYAACERSERVYRHRWRSGDVLLWDNRCTMHYAVRDYAESDVRLMQRTTAAGDRPR